VASEKKISENKENIIKMIDGCERKCKTDALRNIQMAVKQLKVKQGKTQSPN
jgi:hypothetical protein